MTGKQFNEEAYLLFVKAQENIIKLRKCIPTHPVCVLNDLFSLSFDVPQGKCT